LEVLAALEEQVYLLQLSVEGEERVELLLFYHGDSRGDGDVVCTLSLLLLFYVHLYHDDGLVQLKKHLRIIKLK